MVNKYLLGLLEEIFTGAHTLERGESITDGVDFVLALGLVGIEILHNEGTAVLALLVGGGEFCGGLLEDLEVLGGLLVGGLDASALGLGSGDALLESGDGVVGALDPLRKRPGWQIPPGCRHRRRSWRQRQTGRASG